MDENIGIIAVYKVLVGSNAGKIYRTRFENVGAFAAWSREYEYETRRIEILNTKVVTSDRVWWDDRWVAAKAN